MQWKHVIYVWDAIDLFKLCVSIAKCVTLGRMKQVFYFLSLSFALSFSAGVCSHFSPSLSLKIAVCLRSFLHLRHINWFFYSKTKNESKPKPVNSYIRHWLLIIHTLIALIGHVKCFHYISTFHAVARPCYGDQHGRDEYNKKALLHTGLEYK